MPIKPSDNPTLAVKVSKLRREDIDSLAALLVTQRITPTAQEVTEFYATEQGRAMKTALDAQRAKKKGGSACEGIA